MVTVHSSSLWEQIVSWDNLWLAYRKAAKGKRGHAPAATFDFQLADHLLDLQSDLIEGSYQPGAYRSFYIHEPKRRQISAAPFRDRVVHHALCNSIEPLFERRFYHHSYANRVGKGTHRAIDQLQSFARHYRYVLRCDIVKHFPSLDHAILRAEIACVIQDAPTMNLIDKILWGGVGVLDREYDMVYFTGDTLFAPLRPRGLPIGNLTSQFRSNCYLNPIDWFVVRELRCSAYLRYVDDFALFSNSKTELYEWKTAIIERLARFRLTLHERKAQVLSTRTGIPWLGFIIYPAYRLLKRRNAIHYRRRYRSLVSRFRTRALTFADVTTSVQGWINHVRYADTWGLRNSLFNTYPV